MNLITDTKTALSGFKRYSRTVSTWSLGILYGAAIVLAPAAADDTEVFFGAPDPSANTQPNIMLVLDTSSSMNRTDGVHITRLERLKESLNSLLDTAANVNMGLMRFNGSGAGGAVLFPVTDLDKEMCADEDCGQVKVSSRIADDLDDVSESLTDNSVTTSSDWLELGQNSASVKQSTGLRFSDLSIPQGARIIDASVEFTAYQDSSGAASLSISAEQHDDAPTFTATSGSVSSRTFGSTVNWDPASWTESTLYNTPDLTPILQEIVNRSSWCGGNSIVLNIEGTGKRDAVSSQFSLADAPRLVLKYDAGGIPASGGCTNASLVRAVSHSDDDAEQDLKKNNMNRSSSDLELPYEREQQMIGIRFDNLDLPQGAVINNAYLEFQIDEYKTGDVTLYIKGQAADNASSFSKSKHDITDRSPTANSELWVNPPELPVGEKIRSPELKSIVQEIVDRSGWSSGNAMVFLLGKSSGSGRRIVESFNGDASAAPKLFIDYKVPSGSAGSLSTTITARDKLREVIADIRYEAGTPLVDAYYEAAQYYRNGLVDYGKVRGTPGKAANRVSHPDSWDPTTGYIVRDPLCTDADLGNSICASEYIAGAPRYVSPIVSSCQTSNIVLLSDGGASSNTSADRIRTLTGIETCEVDKGSEACARSLATWLYENDHNGVSGKQIIPTYTIGFNLGAANSAVLLLRDIAKNGGGSFYEAQSAAELTVAFESIFAEVLDIDTSFVAPGATVNQFNRLTHRSDIYFAVFKPDGSPTWNGNLKRYAVGKTGDDELGFLDVNGDPAVDAGTGYFSEESQSWWSSIVDGNAVGLGGAAGRMVFDGVNGPSTRRVFTYTGPSTVPSAGVDLTASEHALGKSNNKITLDMLGLGGLSGTTAEREKYRDDLLDWATGVDINDEDEDGDTTDWRAHMGDPMHSKPLVVNYGEDVVSSKSTIFVATNEGFLHAIDSDTGDELYSFIPQELLPNLNIFMENISTNQHPYGLDGSLSLSTEDINNDVIINSNEDAVLYVGMRRGGGNYYAIDVSDRLKPRLKWVIKGGTGGTTGFENLGQSWSRMVPTKITHEGATKNVLIFAGGYDTNQDDDPSELVHVRTTDNVGRGIYIIDANTGALIWSGLGVSGGSQLFSDMKYSIPSDIRVVDVDVDGLADQLYVGDMGGQIWRFDMVKSHTTGDLVTGGVIAKLSGTGSDNERRFYYEPDVALIGKEGKRFLSISVGSGWRAHPLDRVVNDRFYMLKSTDIYAPPASGVYTAVTESDLVNISDSIEPETNDYGWYLELTDPGEKVLGHSVTINNQIIFTSYKPSKSAGDCSVAVGGGAVYVLDVLDGSPTVDADEDGILDEEDRQQELTHGGIPPEAVALITEHGTVVAVQTQTVDVDFNNLTQRTFWNDMSPTGESADAISSIDE